MRLCYGCLHPFPESSLTELSALGPEVSLRLETVRSLMAKVAPATAQTRQCLASMEDELKKVTIAVDRELDAKQRRIDDLALQVKYLNAHDEEYRGQVRSLQQQCAVLSRPAHIQRPRSDAPAYSSKLLQRFLAASKAQPLRPRPSSEGAPLRVENRYGETITNRPRHTSPDSARGLPSSAPGGGGRTTVLDGDEETPTSGGVGRSRRGGSGTGRGAATVLKPVDMASAAIYTALEHCTVATRSALAILWVRRGEQDELVCPFVVGSEVRSSRLSSVAPPSVRIASSTAGTVLLSGVAVNVMVAPGTAPPEAASQSIEGTARSSLYIPVFRRYQETQRETRGVLQLVAWGDAVPFSTVDEVMAAKCSDHLCHIFGLYHAAFAEDWTTRTFDPNPLTKHATFDAAMDSRRGEFLGTAFGSVGECIESTRPSYLILRTDMGRGDASTLTPRLSKQDAIANAKFTITSDEDLKDVGRYTATIEGSWKQAVAAQADLQRRVDALQDQLERARHGLNEYRRQQGPSSNGMASADGERSTQPQLTFRERAEKTVMATRPGTTNDVSRHPRKSVFSGAELDDMETETQRRLDVVGSASTKQRGGKVPVPPPTGPAVSARVRNTTFLTDPK